jgi:hypothetical protein
VNGESRQQRIGATSTRLAPKAAYLREDGDKDGDEEGERNRGQDDDSAQFARYARANTVDAKTIAKLVRRYYAAAFAGDGAKACSMLSTTIAHGVPLEQAQATQRSGDTCATAIEPLLRQQHGHLAAEDVRRIVVVGVHVKGDTALAVLGFRALPEAQIGLEREGGRWKIDALFDNPLA